MNLCFATEINQLLYLADKPLDPVTHTPKTGNATERMARYESILKHIEDVIREHQPITSREIAELTMTTKSGSDDRLEKLIKQGRVRFETRNKTRYFFKD